MLRNRPRRNQKFRHGFPIPPYTEDFGCLALKLIVEVDGEYHQTDEGRQHDQRRDEYLDEQRSEVARAPSYEVLRDAAAVRRRIEAAIDGRTEKRTPSSPALLPHDEGEHHSPSSRGRRVPG